jgi:hypothetical protein
MLFLAAITSSISMLQPVIAFLEEGFDLKRHASATLLGLITALGSAFVVYFSKNTLAMDTCDFWVGTFLIFILALVQSLIYGWALGIEEGEREAHQGAHIRIPRVVQYILKYVTPLYLMAIFVGVCYHEFLAEPSAGQVSRLRMLQQEPVALASVILIGLVFVFLVLLVRIADKRWRSQKRYENIIVEEVGA